MNFISNFNFLFCINFLHNEDKYISSGFQPESDDLQARNASNSPGITILTMTLI